MEICDKCQAEVPPFGYTHTTGFYMEYFKCCGYTWEVNHSGGMYVRNEPRKIEEK